VCRFYALRASAPTRVDCCLVQAPNSLLAQSRQDLRGFENADGWGIAAFGELNAGIGDWSIERRPDPAHDGHRFRAAAARTQATTVVAHVRRATVGTVALENTHPFRHGRWIFVHNGTVPYFAAIRDAMLAAMSAEHRAAIRGSTDSEHLFHLALSTYERIAHERTAPAPESPLLVSLQLALRQVVPGDRPGAAPRPQCPLERRPAHGRQPLAAGAPLPRACQARPVPGLRRGARRRRARGVPCAADRLGADHRRGLARGARALGVRGHA
jgi:hypothetical protein